MRYAFLAILLAALSVGAQTANQNTKDESPQLSTTSTCENCLISSDNLARTPTLMLFNTGSDLMEMRDRDGNLIVRIPREGKLTYGENYKPEDGAKTFWEVLARAYPQVCKPEVEVKK